jgi:GH24 family phage-related lysozyme (muramidase)
MEYKILNEKMRKKGRKNGELYPNDPEILEIFEKDVKEAEEKIKFNSLPSLSQNQFDSLISFTFNTGYVPDILNDLKNNNIESVYNKIKNHSNESNDTGLIDRRKIEAELFIKDGEIR